MHLGFDGGAIPLFFHVGLRLLIFSCDSVHVLLSYVCVDCRSPEHHGVTTPPEGGLYLLEVRHRQDGLGARLGGAADVVRERARNLDLESRDETDRKTENAAYRHNRPEMQAAEMLEAADDRDLAKTEHERQEEDDGIEIVVEHEPRDVILHSRKYLFREYGIQRDAEAG